MNGFYQFACLIQMGMSMKEHKCQNKHFLAADGIENGVLCVAYVCEGCRDKFFIPLSEIKFKKEDSFQTNLVRNCFNTSEGRKAFANSCE